METEIIKTYQKPLWSGIVKLTFAFISLYLSFIFLATTSLESTEFIFKLIITFAVSFIISIIQHGFCYQFTHDGYITHWYGWRKKIYPKETLELRYKPQWGIFNTLPVLYASIGKKKTYIKIPQPLMRDLGFLAQLTSLTGEPENQEWKRYLDKLNRPLSKIKKVFLSLYFSLPLILFIVYLIYRYPSPPPFTGLLLLMWICLMFMALSTKNPSTEKFSDISFILYFTSLPLIFSIQTQTNLIFYFSGLALLIISNLIYLIPLHKLRIPIWQMTAICLIIFAGVIAFTPIIKIKELTRFKNNKWLQDFHLHYLNNGEVLIHTYYPDNWLKYKEGGSLTQWNPINIDTTKYYDSYHLIFSPDGYKSVTKLRNYKEKGVIDLFESKEGKLYYLNTLKRSSSIDIPYSSAYWSPDGKYLLYWASYSNNDNPKPYYSLVLQEEGKAPRTIYQTQRNVNGINWNKDGFAYTLEWTADTVGKDIRSIYYMEKFDMNSALNQPGSRVQPIPIRTIELPRIHKALPRIEMNISSDGKYFCYQKTLKDGEFYQVYGITSTGEETYSIQNNTNVNYVDYIDYAYDLENHLLLLARKTSKRRTAITKIDFLTGKETIIKTVYGNIRFVSISPDGKHIIYEIPFTLFHGGSYLAIDMDGTHHKLLFGGMFTYDLCISSQWSQDSRYLYALKYNNIVKSLKTVILYKIDFQ
jgi:hypothetical protein